MSEDFNGSSFSRSSVRQHLNDFAGYTTFHGLHFVIEPHGKLRRLIWLIFILGGLAICTRQLVISYTKLRAHNHVISKEMIPSEKLPFPAVTFCNENMMRKTSISGTDAQLYLDQLNVLKKMYLPNEFVNKTLNSSFDIEKAVLKHGHTAAEMIMTCTWNGEFCTPINVSTFFSHLVSTFNY